MTTPTDGTGDGPHPAADGSIPLADEAHKLLTVVQEWAQRALPEPASGHPGPECQWCPLCQFASILRGEHPEVSERFAEAGTALAGALRSFIDAAANHAPVGGSPDPRRADARKAAGKPRPGKPKPSPRVQHIRLDGVNDAGSHDRSELDETS
ncbi:MAG: hypothetical protein ACR2LX_10675 [Jatrophihabitans sp.]